MHTAEFGVAKHHHGEHECQFDDFLKQPFTTADIFDFALPAPRLPEEATLISVAQKHKTIVLAFFSRAPPTII